MYNDFYGFSDKPFDVTTNPHFLFLTERHKEALASLLYGIQERRGIMVLLGEVGTGKTTLLKAAVKRLEDSVKIAFLFNTACNYEELMEMVLDAFGIYNPHVSLSSVGKFNKLKKYVEFMAKKGVNHAVIIDEAQNLDYESLENWRLLSNLENEQGKLIQIVLSGQPELEIKLKDHRMRQLDQRVSIRQYIGPLGKKETFEYIEHRFSLVGSRNLFDEKSLKIIRKYSQGIPRKINSICDNALLIGYATESEEINASITREAVKDLTGSVHNRKSFRETNGCNSGFSRTFRLGDTKIQSFARGVGIRDNLKYVFGLFLIACVIGALGYYFLKSMF